MSSDESSCDMDDWFLINSNGDVISSRDLVADYIPRNLKNLAQMEVPVNENVSILNAEAAKMQAPSDEVSEETFELKPQFEKELCPSETGESSVKSTANAESEEPAMKEELEITESEVEVNAPVRKTEYIDAFQEGILARREALSKEEEESLIKELLTETREIILNSDLLTSAEIEEMIHEQSVMLEPVIDSGQEPVIKPDIQDPVMKPEIQDPVMKQEILGSEMKWEMQEQVAKLEKPVMKTVTKDQQATEVRAKVPVIKLRGPVMIESNTNFQGFARKSESAIKVEEKEIESFKTPELVMKFEKSILKGTKPFMEMQMNEEGPVIVSEKTLCQGIIDAHVVQFVEEDSNFEVNKLSQEVTAKEYGSRTIPKEPIPRAIMKESVPKRIMPELVTKVKAKKAKVKESLMKGETKDLETKQVSKAKVISKIKAKKIIPKPEVKKVTKLETSDPKSNDFVPKQRSDSSSDISLIDDETAERVRSNEATGTRSRFINRTALAFKRELGHQLSRNLASAQTFERSAQTSFRRERIPTRSHGHVSLCDTIQHHSDIMWTIAFLVIALSCLVHVGSRVKNAVEEVPSTIGHLDIIQANVYACLGHQQMQSLQHNGTRKRFYTVCQNEMESYREEIEKHFADRKVQSFLFTAQGLIHKNSSEAIPILIQGNISHLNVELLVHQLEYYELLPKVLDKPEFVDLETTREEAEIVLKRFHDVIKNLTALNKELQGVIFVNDFQHKTLEKESVSYDEASLTNDQKYFTDLLENILDRKLEAFTNQYGNLRQDIQDLKKDHIAEIVKAIHMAKEPDDHFSHLHQEVHQVKSLQNNILEQVKTLFMLISNIESMMPNETHSDPIEEQWTLENLKENLQSYISEAQKDIQGTVDEYKKDVTEVLNSYIEDGKKQAEKVLNSVADYAQIAEKETRNLINDKIPESVMSGIWDVWGKMKKKWSNVKQELKDIVSTTHCKSEPKQSKGSHNKKKELRKFESVNVKSVEQSTEWLFERATQREEKRNNNMINWYLARERLREKQRKWNHQQQHG